MHTSPSRRTVSALSHRLICASVAALLLAATPLAAQVTSWTSGNSTPIWNDAGNWDNGIPNAITDAVILSTAAFFPAVFTGDPATQNLTIQGGASLTLGGGFDLTVSGDFTNNGSFTHGGQAVELIGGGILGGSSVTLFDDLEMSGGGTRTLTNNVDLDGRFTLSANTTMAMGSRDLSVTGNFVASATGATIIGTSGIVSLTGTGSVTTGTHSVPHVTISGGIRTANTSLVAGNLLVTGGTLTINDSATVTVNGNATFTAGTVQWATNFAGIETLDVDGNLTITGTTIGSTSADSFMHVGGNYANDAIWAPTAGTVQLDGAGSTTVGGLAPNFFNLEITAGTKTVSSATNIDGNLTLASGATLDTDAALDIEGDVTLGDASASWDAGGAGLTHTIAGVTNSTGGLLSSGASVTGLATLEFDGTLDINLVSVGTAIGVPNVRLASTGKLSTFGVSVNGDLEVTSGELELLNNATLAVSGDATLSGGTLSFNDTFAGFETLDVAGTANLTGCAAGTMNVNSRIACEGDFTSTISWIPLDGTVVLDGGLANISAAELPNATISSGTKTFTAVSHINGTLNILDGATLDANAALDVDGNTLLNTTGAWDLGLDTHTVSGNLTSTGGSATGVGIVELNGAGTLTTSGGGEITNVLISGTLTAGTATITNDLTMTAGSLEILNNATLLVKGNVNLDAPGTLLWTTTVGGAEDVLDVDGNADITCNAGTTTTLSRLRVAGDWSSNSNFAPTNGVIELDGLGGNAIAGIAPSFYNLSVLSSRSIDSATLVANDLIIAGGSTLTSNASTDVNGSVSLGVSDTWDLGNSTHTVAGSWFSSGGDATSIGTGLIDFDGTGDLDTGAASIAKVLISDGIRTVADSTVAGDLELNGLSAALSINTGATLTVGGNADLLVGTLTFPGVVSGSPDVLDIAGDADVQVAVSASSSDTHIRVAGGWSSTATFAPAAGVVELDGGTITSASGPSFADLTVVSGDKTLTGVTTLAGSLRIDAGSILTLPLAATTLTVDTDVFVDGALVINNNDVSVAGAWNSGFIGASVTGTADVVLTGNGNIGTGLNTLPNVRVTGGLRTSNDVVVSGDLTVETGATLNLLDNTTLAVAGNADIQTGGALGFQNTTPGIETLDVEGNVNIGGSSSGTTANTRIHCGGNWTSAATWVPLLGEVVLDNSSVATFGGPSLTFANLRLASGTKTATAAVTVTSNLFVDTGANLVTTVAAMTVAEDASLGASGGWNLGALTHDVAGDWTSTGASATGTAAGTVRLTADGVIGTGGGSIQNLVSNAGVRAFNTTDVLGDTTVNAGSMRINNNAIVTVGGNLTVTGVLEWFGLANAVDDVLDVAGSIDLSTATSGASSTDSVLRVGGSWLSTSAYDPANGSVEMSGTVVTVGGTLPTFTSLHLPTGSLVTVNTTAVIDGTLVVDTGATLDTDAPISVGASVTLGATGGWETGAFTHVINGAFTSTGAPATDGAAGSTLQIIGGGDLGGASVVIDNLDIQVGNHTISDLTVSGSLNMDGGTFNIANNQTVTVAGNANFNAGTLGFLNSSAGIELLDIEGDVLMLASDGTTSANTRIECAGSWTAGSAFSPANGTVSLDGAALTNLGPTTPGGTVTFNDLVVTNAGIREVSDDFDLSIDNLVIDSGAELRLAGRRVAIPGSAVIVNGKLNLDAGSELALGSTAVVSVSSTGTLRVVGTPGVPATIAGESGGGYFLSVDGSLEALYFVIQEMGPSGVVISQTATLGTMPEDFRAGVLSHPSAIPSSVMLDIRRNSPTEFRYVDFEDPFANGTFNVRTLGGSPITFANSGGNIAGEAFDTEILGLVTWIDDLTVIVDFFATAGLLTVDLSWETFTEVDATDFVVRRATTFGGPFTDIAILPAIGAPQNYQVIDNTVVAQQFYVYQLWEVLTTGTERLITQRTATPWGPDLPPNVLDVGPGGTYADIDSAIAAAALSFNPVIKISTGNYPAFTVDPVFGTLRIYADTTGPVTIDTTLQPVLVQSQPVTSAVEIFGLQIGDGTGTNEGVVVQDCEGLVILDSLVVQGGVGASAIRIDNSDRVAIDRTSLTGTPSLRVENSSITSISGGTLADVVVEVSSKLRTNGLSGYASSVDGTSTLIPFPSTAATLDLPRFPVLDTPFTLTMTGAGSGTWFMFLSFDIAWLDLHSAGNFDHHHVGLIDLGLGNLLVLGPLPASGTLSFPGSLPPDALLLGFPIVVQIVIEDPISGKFSWSNASTLIGMPQ